MDFGSLNMENIENILSSMSSEDMEMLSSMAQSFFSSQSQRSEEKKEEPVAGGNPFSSFNFDFETLSKIMSVIEKLNRPCDDPRYNLLLSLRPLLSNKRQEKVDDALKILSLLSLLPIIEELGGKA